MKITKILFSFLLIMTNLNFYFSKDLKFLFEIFRHGARSPISLNQNNLDIFGEKWSGKGELTSVGMRQHFLLGYRNNQTYFTKLNILKYSPKEIFITSTDVNRTIMSAYSQLQGMFPSLSGPILNDQQLKKALPPFLYNFNEEIILLKNNALKEKTNVFPIRIINPVDHDFYLHDSWNCEGIKNLYSENLKNEKLKNFIEKFNKTYGDRIYNALNKTAENYPFSQYENIHAIFDSFVSGYFDSRKFEKLTTNNIDLQDFLKLSTEFTQLDIYTTVLGDKNLYAGKMSMSPLFNKILSYMDRRINNDINNINIYTSNDPKISMLSGHDTNLAAVMIFLKAAFNNTELIHPNFASSIYFELNYNSSVEANTPEDKYFVDVYFDDENVLKGSMKYNEFKDKVSKILVSSEEIKNFCGFKDDLGSTILFLLVSVVVLGVIVLGLGAWYVFLVTRKKEQQEDFQPVIL